MTKVAEIAKIIEEYAPLSLCFEGDSSGLSIGNLSAEAQGILICVDVTVEVLKEAVMQGCNLIISHHPAVFYKTKTFLTGSFECDIIKYALENNLNLYSAHSNLDACSGGINERLCEMLGISVVSGKGQFWRIGIAKTPISLLQFEKEVSQTLRDKHVKTAGKSEELCSSIAVASGSGGRDEEFVQMLSERGVDTFITSEAKVSVVRKLNYYNIKLVEVGHFDSEKNCKNIFMELLCHCGVKLVQSSVEQNPYN